MKWKIIFFIMFLSSSSFAQQVIAKGSWKLEDNGAPFTIWGSYRTSAECQAAYPLVLSNAKSQVAQAQSKLDAVNNSIGTAAYTPQKNQVAYDVWSDLNNQELALEGAICIQQ
jgi:hypothetical protein